jgi:hypothetical protein|tara:strand:+ start:7380 stop:9092 length:1713 start_codon:yes stop_codon:yes gene_type:complete
VTKKNISTILCICLVSASFAQIPELDIRNNAAVAQTGIEKVRLAYDKGDYLTAESLLYTELEKGNVTPNNFLLFANTLYAVNKPSLAKEFYGEYAKGTENKDAQMQIQRLFSSNVSATEQRTIQTKYPITNPTTYGAKLYTALGGRMMSYNKTCEGDVNSRSEILAGITDAPFGSIAFFDNGEMAVASLINTKSNTCRLYIFHKKKGVWKKPTELFADTKGNFAFPFIDEETSTLYFSSDKSGSVGGYDIYKSVYSGSTFESPLSLGSDINSAGNDINPTLIKDWLYFSSNGHISKGGYDIFKYKKLSDFNALFINAIELNTAKNELSIVPGGINAVLVNRTDNDTATLVRILRPKIVSTVSGIILNEAGEPISGALVLFNTGADKGNYLTTGPEGKYTFKSALNFPSISGVVVADGYVTKAFNTSNGEKASIQLAKLKPVEIIVEVIRTVPATPTSSDTTNLMADTSTVDSLSSDRESCSDLYGGAELPTSGLDSGSYLIVIASAYDYAKAYDSWTKWLPSFSKAEILEYGNGLYRVGFYIGNDEDEAVTLYNEAKELKKDIWLLHPNN